MILVLLPFYLYLYVYIYIGSNTACYFTFLKQKAYSNYIEVISQAFSIDW